MITVYERVGNAMSKSHVRLDTKGDFFMPGDITLYTCGSVLVPFLPLLILCPWDADTAHQLAHS